MRLKLGTVEGWGQGTSGQETGRSKYLRDEDREIWRKFWEDLIHQSVAAPQLCSHGHLIHTANCSSSVNSNHSVPTDEINTHLYALCGYPCIRIIIRPPSGCFFE